MTAGGYLAVAAAGFAAGAANAVAGGGTLITFPTLLAVGLPPLAANVTNTVGLVPGAVGGALGYREELRGQRGRLARLLVPALVGAGAGVAALLLAPGSTFRAVVPGLIAFSCVLLLLQPRIARSLPARSEGPGALLTIGLVLAGAYGAYFGSAVSILLLALLTIFLADTVQRLNALKVVLAGLVNLAAAFVYAFLAPVHWSEVAILAAGSLLGGAAGARGARHLPGDALRVGIACAGLVVAAVLAAT
jgi:uncharacterized membrane protein YfcA